LPGDRVELTTDFFDKIVFMGNLSNIGRIFYGIAIAVLGFLTIYYHDFPYMLIPPHQGLVIVAYISGIFLVLAGGCIVFGKKIMLVSLLSWGVLLAVFCCYFIPYQLMASSRYMHFGEWENAAKELALASGALVIAGQFSQKLMPLGVVLFSLTIISFGIDHFLFAHEASDYIPSWVPNHLFWMYFTGSALLGSGIAIMLNIRRGLAAVLLGGMIFIWFIILHVPRVIAAPADGIGGEVASAMLALAYCGIAFVIAGVNKIST
jgi:uncharacterized membrane protein